MTRTIEVFTAGCGAGDETVSAIRAAACSACDVRVLDMRDSSVATRAKALGIGAVPAVVIDGKLADCCGSRGPDLQALRAAGLGSSA